LFGSLHRHRLAGQPAGRRGGLKIKAAGDAVNVQQFARKKSPGQTLLSIVLKFTSPKRAPALERVSARFEL
jgi:hypothetical protein